MRSIERTAAGLGPMWPSAPDPFDLVSTRRSAREAEAAAERLRPPHGLRLRTAALLLYLAHRLAPTPSGAPAEGRLAHR